MATDYTIPKDEYRALLSENKRLRELVRDMYKAFQRVFPDGHRLDFEMDMHELGVEVTS